MNVRHRPHDVVGHDPRMVPVILVHRRRVVHVRGMAQRLHGAVAVRVVQRRRAVHPAVVRHPVFVLHGKGVFHRVRLTLHKARSHDKRFDAMKSKMYPEESQHLKGRIFF